MSDESRKLVIRGAGILIVLIALGAVLLPLAEEVPARRTIGWMLLLAGMLELAAAGARRTGRVAPIVGGAATLAAGLRLLLDPGAGFFEVLNLVILWLVVHAAAAAWPAVRSPNVLGSWTGFSAAVDLLLAVALLAGLPIALLVVGLFGPTRPISATFAWVLAVSFIAHAARLLASPAQVRRGAGRPPDKPAD